MTRLQYHRKPHNFKRKKSILKTSLFWFVFLGIALFSFFVYLFLFSETFQVKEITVSGQKEVSGENIILLAKEESRKKTGPFEINSIFLLSSSELEKLILDDFVKISEVKVRKHFFGKLEIDVKERVRLFVFCQQDECFLLDKEGVIFEKVEAKEYADLTMRDDSKNPVLGEAVVSKEELEKMTVIYSEIDSGLKIFLDELLVVNEDRWNVLTSQGWEIYFNPKEDLNWQLTKLSALLEEKIPLESMEDLDYVELRFGNFAPYRFK
ncbi:MAG: cell division protein FtsQ/DivIB [Candidatus Nealsonbacteria bacterium]